MGSRGDSRSMPGKSGANAVQLGAWPTPAGREDARSRRDGSFDTRQRRSPRRSDAQLRFHPMRFCTVFFTRAVLAAALTAVLAACGGGGGGTAAPAASPSPSPSGATASTDSGAGSGITSQAPSTPPAYAPLMRMPVHRYGTGSPQALLFEALNAARLAVGAGALSQNAKLDQMAASQLAWLAAHPGAPLDSNRTSGSAAGTPSERAALAGYAGSVWEEVASNGRYSGGDCAAALLDSAYRAAGVLSSHRDVGLAYGPVAPGVYACIVSLGVQASTSAQLPVAGTLKAWPYPAQAGVQPAVAAGEFPAAAGLQASIGRPILVSMFDAGALPSSRHRVTRFTLLDDAGHELPARLLANAEMDAGPGVALVTEASAGRLQSGDLLLLPLAPLAPGRRYTVEFSGTSGGLVYDKRWSFTTS